MKTIKNHLLKMSLAIILACLALQVAAFEATPLGDFKILKNREGIDLYYRWMQMPEGNQVRQMKAVLDHRTDHHRKYPGPHGSFAR